jgi:predicted AlkP superfamily phosphohydrolase/phosphomutase
MTESHAEIRFRDSLWLGLALGLANGLLAAAAALWTHNPLLGSWYFVWDFVLRALARLVPEWLAAALGGTAGCVFLFSALGLLTGTVNALLLRLLQPWIRTRARLGRAHVVLAVFLLLFTYSFVSTFDVAFSQAEMTGMAMRIIGTFLIAALLGGWLVARLAGARLAGIQVRRPQRWGLAVAVAVALLPGVVSALGERARRGVDAGAAYAPAPGKVILLGIDGLERSLVAELRALGKMPNFDRAIKDGVIGPLRTIVPYYSPVVWTSVATGKRPPKHGVTGFVDAETHDADLLDRRDIKAAALWDITAARHLRGGFVNWYYTWPAVEPGDGYMVSDRLVYTDLPFNEAPDSLGALVRAEVQKAKTTYSMDRFVKLEYDPNYTRFAKNTAEYERHHFYKVLKRSIERDVASAGVAVAAERVAGRRADLLALYIRASDAVAHIHWKYRVGRDHPRIAKALWGVSEEDVAAFGDAVYAYYQVVDEILGRIMALMDAQTTLIISSDHGFGFNLAGGRVVKLDRLLVQLGALEFKDENEDIDWSKTQFFDNPNNLRIATERRISANLAGREPQGTQSVEANRQAAPVLAERLRRLRTTEGWPVFTDVHLSELAGGTDLVVKIERNLPLDGAIDLGDGEQFPISEIAVNFRISGMHRMDATLLMTGAGIARGGSVRSAGVLDIAPTVLHLLGQPIARDMDGRLLSELLSGEPAKRTPVYVDSYDQYRIVDAESAVSDNEVDEVIKEQLRSLGYIQ